MEQRKVGVGVFPVPKEIPNCGTGFGSQGELIRRVLCLGSNDGNLLNSSGEDPVPELQAKSPGSNDVMLNRGATPGATVDGYPVGRIPLTIKPPAPNPIPTIAKHPNRVQGIPGGDEHAITDAEILLADLFEASRLFDRGSQGDGNARQRIPS